MMGFFEFVFCYANSHVFLGPPFPQTYSSNQHSTALISWSFGALLPFNLYHGGKGKPSYIHVFLFIVPCHIFWSSLTRSTNPLNQSNMEIQPVHVDEHLLGTWKGKNVQCNSLIS